MRSSRRRVDGHVGTPPPPRCECPVRSDGAHRAGRECRWGRQRSACRQGDRQWPHASRRGAGPGGAGRKQHARDRLGGGTRGGSPAHFRATPLGSRAHLEFLHGAVSGRMRVAVCRVASPFGHGCAERELNARDARGAPPPAGTHPRTANGHCVGESRRSVAGILARDTARLAVNGGAPGGPAPDLSGSPSGLRGRTGSRTARSLVSKPVKVRVTPARREGHPGAILDAAAPPAGVHRSGLPASSGAPRVAGHPASRRCANPVLPPWGIRLAAAHARRRVCCAFGQHVGGGSNTARSPPWALVIISPGTNLRRARPGTQHGGPPRGNGRWSLWRTSLRTPAS